MKKMYWFLTGVACLAAGPAPALPASPDLIAQVHFTGAAQIAADTNAAAFTNLWCSPEAQALRNQTLDKLARAPYAWFKSKLGSVTNDAAAWFRPLLDDGLNGEWFLQIRDATNGSPEYTLAIQLSAVRASLWQTNLENVLAAWTGMAGEKTTNGWSLKKHRPPNRARFVRAGDWVVLGCGQDELPLTGEIVRRVSAGQLPGPVETNAWLSADLDWPRLARWLPESKSLGLPETQLQLAGRGGNLRWSGKLVFPQPLKLTLEPWRLPTNTIHMPIAGFAAVRGLRPWLQKQDWLKPYALSPQPEQMFIWAMATMPLQTFAAVPVPDVRKALAEMEQKLSANVNWQSQFMMPVKMGMTNNRIAFTGLPYIAPTLQALREPAGDFLFAGFFPNTPPNQPLPADLFVQLAPGNLVYYHWEVTGKRLEQLPHLTQLALMITRHRQLDAKSAAGSWLKSIGPTLGSTVTTVVQSAPNELTLERKAPAGFTAIELTALASWLEAANFPGCDLRLPPPAVRPKRVPQKPPGPSPTATTNSAKPFVLH